LEIAKVDFIGVDNFFASSLVAPVCENPLRDKKLIIELVWDKHLEYSQKEPQDLSSKRSNFGILKRVLFLVECYMIIKKKG
jgi:hypothetical protein